MAVALPDGIPTGNETAAYLLLNTLAGMATSVVSYGFSSSAGNARKGDRLTQSGK